jgi:hypothetical protein
MPDVWSLVQGSLEFLADLFALARTCGYVCVFISNVNAEGNHGFRSHFRIMI